MKNAKSGKKRTGILLAALVCAGALAAAFLLLRTRPDRRLSAAYDGPPPSPIVAAQSPEAASPDPGELYQRLEWKPGQFVLVQYGTSSSTALDTSGFSDPDRKNSLDLVKWAEMAWENQWGYVWGTFGQVLSGDLLAGKLDQYPDALGPYEQLVRDKWMGRRVADCVGLVKSYGWYDPDTGGIEYASGTMPDVGTDGMWEAATVKGDIDTMPDQPGVLVYSSEGHLGVYVGDGYAIEAISHAGGVVKTKVADRPWTGWMQCPYIHYGD